MFFIKYNTVKKSNSLYWESYEWYVDIYKGRVLREELNTAALERKKVGAEFMTLVSAGGLV